MPKNCRDYNEYTTAFEAICLYVFYILSYKFITIIIIEQQWLSHLEDYACGASTFRTGKERGLVLNGIPLTMRPKVSCSLRACWIALQWFSWRGYFSLVA